MNLANTRSRREASRFAKFAVVGVVGAVVDFGVFNLLLRFAGFGAVISSVLSFTAAVTSNFIWNRYWTYPDSRSKPLPRQATQFIVVSLVGLAIRTPMVALLEAPMARLAQRLPSIAAGLIASEGTPLVLPPAEVLGANLALAPAVIVVLFWNFLANRFWTYSDVE
jgi:putative flippase GtrA